MNTLIQLVTEAIRSFLEIIPRVKKVCADEQGIKFLLWDKVKVLYPWIYVYIPLFTKIEVITITRRSISLKKQSLVTKDFKNIMIESSCFYKVVDIRKAIVDNHDVRDIIEDIVLSNIRFHILNNTLEYILNNSEQIEKEVIEKTINSEEWTWVKVLSVRITDLAPCIHFNNIKNVTYIKWVLD